MSNWIFNGYLTLLFGAIALFLLLLPVVNAVYRKHGYFHFLTIFLYIGTILSICSLIAFTVFPLPFHGEQFCKLRTLYDYWQTTPFMFLSDFSEKIGEVGFRSFLTSGTLLQVVFNIFLFIPLGFTLKLLFPKLRVLHILLLGFGVSALIELAQGTALFGYYDCPYRVADVDDLMINTFGAGIGYYFGKIFLKIFPRIFDGKKADLEIPTRKRRFVAYILDITLISIFAFTAEIAFNVMSYSIFGSVIEKSLAVHYAIYVLIVGVFGFLVPCMRRNHATLGQASVDIVPKFEQEKSLTLSLIKRGLARYGIAIFVSLDFCILLMGLDFLWSYIKKTPQTFANKWSNIHIITMRKFISESKK